MYGSERKNIIEQLFAAVRPEQTLARGGNAFARQPVLVCVDEKICFEQNAEIGVLTGLTAVMMGDQPADAFDLAFVCACRREQRTGDRRPLLLLIRTGGRAVAALGFMDTNVVQQRRGLEHILRVCIQPLTQPEKAAVAVDLDEMLYTARVSGIVVGGCGGKRGNIYHKKSLLF